MDWYVTTDVGAKPMGPFPEEQVVEMLRSGMTVAAVHPKGDGEWAAPDSHTPFAAAQRESGRSASAPTPRTRAAKLVPRHSKLQVAAYISIVLGFFMYAGDAIAERIRILMGASTGLEMSAYSNTEAAIVTLTNRKGLTQWACYRGEVMRKSDREKVLSAVVCTGEMKPRRPLPFTHPIRSARFTSFARRKTGWGSSSSTGIFAISTSSMHRTR